VRVLQSGHNGGFGAGNNAGIRAGLPDGSLPDYVYILNSDAFPAPDAIRHLLDHLETHPQTGFAGSYIHGLDGDPHVTAFRFPSIRSELEGAARIGPISRLLRDHVVALPVPDSTLRVDWLAGCSLMMRRRMLDEIGLFDEGYFLYFEETDLCLRAAQAGWTTDYVRASAVAHIGSESTGMGRWKRVPGYWLDSRLRYFVKTRGRGGAALATLAHLAGGALCLLRVTVQGGDTGAPPHFLRDMARHALRNLGRRGAEDRARPSGAATGRITAQGRWRGQ
jgi:GT2 family glycosyltransferase